MSITSEYFEKHGYVVLKDALRKDECQKLVDHMFSLFHENKLVKDPQCPLSDSIYGDPIFDNILQKFAKPIGDSVGRTLLPTYTYARIYREGEVLEKHTDRPACEISATLTLGFDSEHIWPIFFDDIKQTSVELNIGELAVYKGCEVVHWRPKFKGTWHVQVFFHYVDANGPHKNQIYDGRIPKENQKINSSDNMGADNDHSKNILIPKPIHNAVIIPSVNKSFPGYFCIDSTNIPQLKFTDEECKKILGMKESMYSSFANIGGTKENAKIFKSIRSANIFSIENNASTEWIYTKIANAVSVVNTIHFDYAISGITHSIQLIEYSSEDEVKGHYDWHIDAGDGEPSHRKISLTAQLSDPKDYEGCELIINNHANLVTGTRERGSIHLFPSYMLHKVSPIIKGTRYALVVWIHGPSRFK